MDDGKINIRGPKLRILLAPLDWGLGHATRCVSIIYELQSLGVTVVLAGDNAIATILKKEFPNNEFLVLEGYQIRYSRQKLLFMLKLMSQMGRIRSSIIKEHFWLKKVVRDHQIDAVISDNRPGLYHAEIPCVYITHQLHIKTGTMIGNKIASALHRFCINRFNICWVPDKKEAPGLSGELSHPARLPTTPVHYIGNLSRFSLNPHSNKKGICILLSGPEPQRTLLENILLPQLSTLQGPIHFVRGLPNAKENPRLPSHVQVYAHLPAKELNVLLNNTEWVICRSGYSTVMDLAEIKTKAILIPTPGQSEQEYLATHLMDARIFYSADQQNLVLLQALENAKFFYANASFPASSRDTDPIKQWVVSLQENRWQQ